MSLALAPAPRVADLDAAVRISAVSRDYGRGRKAVTALREVSLDVGRGEFVCIVGASGCGKSTLLSLIAGLDHPTAGDIETSGGNPALMFQEPALLPWLTVRRNVELPMRLRRTGADERRRRVDRLLATVGLGDFSERRPHELSGGMRQRAALARALAQDASVLLMDEPFAALDAITRDMLHEDLTRIWQETRSTIVFVTHNVREAVRLSDRVALMTSRPGTIGRIWDIDLDRPRTLDSPQVARLAGEITAQLRREIHRDDR